MYLGNLKSRSLSYTQIGATEPLFASNRDRMQPPQITANDYNVLARANTCAYVVDCKYRRLIALTSVVPP